jgi:CDP-glucose 4,6-dehydratase
VGLNPKLWNGKRVLVTGHTGFKGSWLTLILKELGAEVIGLALPPEGPRSLYVDAGISHELLSETIQDIRDEFAVRRAIEGMDPDYVFHLAAQAYVRRSLRDPLESIATNVIGTANVLKPAIASKAVLGVTIITTDKVYENLGAKEPFRETDKLGGLDPYSASKAASEIIVASMSATCNALKIPVTTVRAGNVIGGGDWGEERLVPDLVRALNGNSKLIIRNPNATRPWQFVLDCLYGYLLVAQSHMEEGGDVPNSVNFGPDESLSVTELVRLFEAAFGRTIELEESKSTFPESEWLRLDSSLARAYFGWESSFSAAQAVSQTANWYSKFESGVDAKELMRAEILKYKVGKW